MARRVADQTTQDTPVVSNPRLLGQDVEELAWLGLGAGVTAVGNDRFVAPLLKTAAPTLGGNGMMGKILDVATTAASAWGVGKLVSTFSANVGKDMFKGGMVLAVMKAIGVIVPGVTFTAGVPIPGGLPMIGAPAMKALPPGNGAAVNGNGNIAQARLGVGKMGL